MVTIHFEPRLIIAIIGLACVAAAALITMIDKRKRERQQAERKDVAHLIGSRQWWKSPPGDPPEGDH